MPADLPADRPRRADARRNRERILRAAIEAFAADGALVPLDEIARRAGVGPGTVYRNFATKEALFGTVVSDRLHAVVQEGRTRLEAADPGDAFYSFLALVVERAMVNHALCDALSMDMGAFGKQDIDADFTQVLDALLLRAREAGAVRSDVDVRDVRTLLYGCLLMERIRRTEGRITAVVFDALRPSNVTKLNNVTMVPSRNKGDCGVCGEPLSTARTGRPARYCGPACRQKAHRLRQA